MSPTNLLSHRDLRNLRVLVTGHAGFVGTHLFHRLEELGALVCGFDIHGERSERGDVLDFSHLSSVCYHFHPDLVFHLAAQAFVPVGFETPRETFEVNALGTVNLLEAIRWAKLDRCAVVVVTTDKVYGEDPWCRGLQGALPFREIDSLSGVCPYSASKVAAEHAVAAYRGAYWRSGSVAVATARAGNIIGPGDWGIGRLIPNAVRALKLGYPAPCYSPGAVRPWQYVEDVLQGYVMLGAALVDSALVGSASTSRFCSAFNFGPDEHHTVAQVLDTVCGAWGNKASWEKVQTDLREAHELRIDSSKAHELLGWKPKWKFEEMIEKTIRWYKDQP